MDNAHTSASRLPPQRSQPGVVGWLQRNLFSSFWNGVLSLITLALLGWGSYQLLYWIFFSAHWERVWANLRLLSVWRYPAELLWRPMTVCGIVMGLFGIAAGAGSHDDGVGRIIQRAFVWVAGLVGVIACIALFAMPDVRLMWLVVFVCSLLGYLLGQQVPGITRGMPWLWGLAWFGSIFLLVGFGEYKPRDDIAYNFLQQPWLFVRDAWGDAWHSVVTSIYHAVPGLWDGPLQHVAPDLWGGILLTFFLSVTGIVVCFPLGIALALGRQSKLPLIKGFCILYIEIIRGAPLITWLFIASLFLPFALGGYTPEAIIRAQVAIILFAAAYMAENVRGGLQAVPKGQAEAARALGMSGWDSLRLIVLPQALRAVIPAIVGLFIGLFKDTSLVTVVSLFDLFAAAQNVSTQPESKLISGGIVRELFIFMSVFYWFFCYRMSVASRQLESQLGVGER